MQKLFCFFSVCRHSHSNTLQKENGGMVLIPYKSFHLFAQAQDQLKYRNLMSACSLWHTAEQINGCALMEWRFELCVSELFAQQVQNSGRLKMQAFSRLLLFEALTVFARNRMCYRLYFVVVFLWIIDPSTAPHSFISFPHEVNYKFRLVMILSSYWSAMCTHRYVS